MVGAGFACVDGMIERVEIGKGLVGQVPRLEVAPDGFDVVEFGGVFRQPFDSKPVRARLQCRACGAADMDRAHVENHDDGLDRLPGPGAVAAVDFLQKGNEISAALGWRGMDDQPTRGAVERAHHGDLPRLAGGLNPQIGTAFCPGARQKCLARKQRVVLRADDQRGTVETDQRAIRHRAGLAVGEPQVSEHGGMGVEHQLRGLVAVQRCDSGGKVGPCRAQPVAQHRHGQLGDQRQDWTFEQIEDGSRRDHGPDFTARAAGEAAGSGAGCRPDAEQRAGVDHGQLAGGENPMS